MLECGPSFKVRTLTAADLPHAMALSDIAGWNQSEADWRRLLHLDPKACLCVECEDKVVATTTLITYGTELAWLGMVLTHRNYLRRGFARSLVRSALDIAEARKVLSIELDATEQGLDLYRALGFREEHPIERWSGNSRRGSALSRVGQLADKHLVLDRQAFGADRTEVLHSLSKTAFVEPGGFAMQRPGIRAAQLGPCVASSKAVAQRLIASCLSTYRGDWYWDLLPSNPSAVAIADEFGFKRARRLLRMVKGKERRGLHSMIYAGSGFELG